MKFKEIKSHTRSNLIGYETVKLYVNHLGDTYTATFHGFAPDISTKSFTEVDLSMYPEIKAVDPRVKVTYISYKAQNLNGSPYPKTVSKQEAERIEKEDVSFLVWSHETSFIIRESELKIRQAAGAEFLTVEYL